VSRRAALIAAAIVLPVTGAHADPWQGETEAGVEYDSNVHRVEERNQPVAAPLLRVAARLEARGGEPDTLRWGVTLGGGARTVLTGIDGEDAFTGAADLTATRRAGQHLALAARATHYEVWPVAGDLTVRAFASSGADVSIASDDDRGRRAAISVGARRVIYKPDADFDWTGPTIAVLLESPLWRGADDRAVDLAAGYRLERRTYQGLGYHNGCAPSDQTTPIAECFVPGDRVRADLVQVASARATYTGARVASVGYELTVDDSTSFGSSLVRQRLTLSVTTPLPGALFATATVTGQLDHFPDPPAVARDLATLDFTSLDDESRSGAAVRIARALGPAWQLEARWAIQATAFADDVTSFRRQVAYAGVTWER